MNSTKVAFIYSKNLVCQLNKITQIENRSNLVISLIHAYGLLEHLEVINPLEANEKHLTLFHSKYYIETLKRLNEDITYNSHELVDYGFEYDCPLIDRIYEFCGLVGGSSITAAHALLSGNYNYAINWFGGWHHAKRDKASGYCYVNDIVLCILTLRKKYNRILYIDMDLHHGDGVQEAFEYTNKVMTLSFHKYSPGFYPGTGSLNDCGLGNGQNYCLNVPLLSGIDDKTYKYLFKEILNKIFEVYKPEVMVIQCGADSLYGDPSAFKSPFNLSSQAYCDCIQFLLDTKIPSIFLGGGGYNLANTARLWTQLTSLICNNKMKLNNDIPEHDYYLNYSPDYELNVNSSRQIRNENSDDYIKSILNTLVNNNLKQIDILK